METKYQPFAAFDTWQDLAVNGAWGEFLGALNEMRGAADAGDVQRAVEVAVRSAALETGAIEGLYTTSRGITRAVALQGALWEAELDKLGPDVRGHFDAQLAAFDLVLDTATKRFPISEKWIRDLHAKVCAAQKTYRVWTEVGWQERPLNHGEYKREPNNVSLADGTTHWYAAVADVAPEMHRLQEELRTPAFEAVHPVLQSAYAHHALTAIHPFSDGNGRTARALASVFLYRAAGVPLVIFSDQQVRYWDALAAADRGEPQAFVTFIDDRAIDSMALVTDRLREAHSSLEDRAQKLRALFKSHGGLTHAEVGAVGYRLWQKIQTEFTELIQKSLPQGDTGAYIEQKGGQCTFWDQPYHSLPSGGAFTLHVQCRNPVQVEVMKTPWVGMANDLSNAFTFIVIDANRQNVTPLKLRIGDVTPEITQAAETLIDGWMRRNADALLDEFHNAIDAALKAQRLA